MPLPTIFHFLFVINGLHAEVSWTVTGPVSNFRRFSLLFKGRRFLSFLLLLASTIRAWRETRGAGENVVIFTATRRRVSYPRKNDEGRVDIVKFWGKTQLSNPQPNVHLYMTNAAVKRDQKKVCRKNDAMVNRRNDQKMLGCSSLVLCKLGKWQKKILSDFHIPPSYFLLALTHLWVTSLVAKDMEVIQWWFRVKGF